MCQIDQGPTVEVILMSAQLEIEGFLRKLKKSSKRSWPRRIRQISQYMSDLNKRISSYMQEERRHEFFKFVALKDALAFTKPNDFELAQIMGWERAMKVAFSSQGEWHEVEHILESSGLELVPHLDGDNLRAHFKEEFGRLKKQPEDQTKLIKQLRLTLYACVAWVMDTDIPSEQGAALFTLIRDAMERTFGRDPTRAMNQEHIKVLEKCISMAFERGDLLEIRRELKQGGFEMAPQST